MLTIDRFLNQYPLSIDKVLHDEHSRVCSAYAIFHVASGKVYVGSTSNTYYRRKAHLNHLTCGTHPNRHLQNAYNLNKELKLRFVLTDTREEAYEIEQRMIDEYMNKGILFNVAKDVRYSGVEFKHKPETIELLRKLSTGRKLSDEAKRKIGLASKGRSVGLKRSPETIAKMQEAQRRQPSPTKEKLDQLKRMALISAQRRLGNKLAENTIQKCKLHGQRTAKHVEIDGVTYNSITEASKVLKVERSVIRNRIASNTPKFQNWKYAER